VSPRRNEAAGVGAPKENVNRRPSLSRQTSTDAALADGFASGGGAAIIFAGASPAGDCGASAATGFGISGFGASTIGPGVSAGFGMSAALGASFAAASEVAGGGFAASATVGAAISVLASVLASAFICFATVSDAGGLISSERCSAPSFA